MNIIPTSHNDKKTAKGFLLLNRITSFFIQSGRGLPLAAIAFVLWVIYITAHSFSGYAQPSVERFPVIFTPIFAVGTLILFFTIKAHARPPRQPVPALPDSGGEKQPESNHTPNQPINQPASYAPVPPPDPGYVPQVAARPSPPIVQPPAEQKVQNPPTELEVQSLFPGLEEEQSFLLADVDTLRNLPAPAQQPEASPSIFPVPFADASVEKVQQFQHISPLEGSADEGAYATVPMNDSRELSPSSSSPGFVLPATGRLERANVGMIHSDEVELETWGFRFPKEGLDPRRSADKLYQRYSRELYRAAVTDGVSASFLPSRWAEIIAAAYVEQPFNGPYEFITWLTNCSAEWYRWTEQEWLLPLLKQATGIQQEQAYWQREIARGAETTLIGCSLAPQQLKTGEVIVHVDAIGDSNFFFVHPVEVGPWPYKAFPLKSAEQFGANPDTLPTALQYIDGTWEYVKMQKYRVVPGDYLILATDALAEWILTALDRGQNPWSELLEIRDEQAFRTFVEQKRASGRMHLDDTTMLVIHLKELVVPRPQFKLSNGFVK